MIQSAGVGRYNRFRVTGLFSGEVILEDVCASEPFDGFSAQDPHPFALARFRHKFRQTMTKDFSEFADGLSATAR